MLLLKTKRDVLLKPLLATSGFVEKKQAMPILSNVYLDYKVNGGLIIIANDLEIQASITIDEQLGDNDFTITLPGKKFQDILKSLPEDALVSLEQQENRMLLKSGKAKFVLQSVSASHYPLLHVKGDVLASFAIAQTQLKKMLGKVQYAMADKDTRVFLNGMLFELKHGQLNLVATDAHRLGFATIALSHNDDGNKMNNNTNALTSDCSVVIPRKTIIELGRLLEESKDNVVVSIYQDQVVFKTKSKQLITKVIDAKYPNYERVIPLGNDKLALIKREDMLRTIDRVAVIGFDQLKTVTLEFASNKLLVSCINEDQEQSLDELDITYTNESPLKINFNLSYVRDLLNYSSGDILQFAFYDNQRSVLVTNPNDASYKAVLMPLRN